MKVLILCSGYKLKQNPFIKDTPVHFLSIRGKPVIEHILSSIQSLEKIERIFILTNSRYLEQFKKWLDDFFYPVPIEFIYDDSANLKEKSGAINSISFAIEKANIYDDLIVMGGDNIFTYDLSGFINFAQTIYPHNLLGVYYLNGKFKAKKFGVVKLGTKGEIIEFTEKPSKLNGSRLVSMCVYFFPKDKLYLIKEYLKDNPDRLSIGDYIHWLSKQELVYAYRFEGEWFDISDIDSYVEAISVF
ncbi:MAG: sugar phosphate nucleotidyltransferase [Candidatus Omnitrophica bacterium]|nr:sugar phosphate nucleotidyltransferase [Candidatus Omnitrophota bacterium]